MPEYWQKIISYIQANWFSIASAIRFAVLAAAIILATIFGIASFRACDLNWGAL